VLQEALEIARPLKDTWSIGFALYNFGVLAMRAGRLDEAERVLEECRILSAATENPFCMACTVFRLGWVAGARGDHGRALELLRESLRLNWRLRNRRVVALCLEQLACLGASSGGPADQARLFGAAETLFKSCLTTRFLHRCWKLMSVELLQRGMCWVNRPSVTRG